jgi:hypothetical protein
MGAPWHPADCFIGASPTRPKDCEMKVISLGFNCHPAYHLRRVLGVEEANFFDWCLTPEADLFRILRDPETMFKSLLDPAAFIYKGPATGKRIIVKHSQFGITFSHDCDSMDEVPKMCEKYRMLADRFMRYWALPDTVFVRLDNHIEEAELEGLLKGHELVKLFFRDEKFTPGDSWEAQEPFWNAAFERFKGVL